MKLNWIELKDFRQYYGRQKIRFAKGSKRNVTVINGINGAGKTSLFTALNWCLYAQGADDIGSLINKRALMETTVGQPIESSVSIAFDHKGEHFIATRTISSIRDSEDELNSNLIPEFLLIKIRRDGQTEVINHPKGMIESILPSAVRTYFLFDGEKIDNFAKSDHEEDVQKAVRNVLKIEALERTGKHLNDVAKQYGDKLRESSSGKLQDLSSMETSRRQEKEKLKSEMKQEQNELRSASKQLGDIDKRLSDISAVREWIERRTSIESEIEEKERDKDRLWSEIRDSINRGHIILAEPICAKAKALLEEKRKRGEIPSGIREQFLKDLLEKAECICGRPIRKHEGEWDVLINMLRMSVPSEVEDLVIRTSGSIQALEIGSRDISAKLRELLANKVVIEDRMTELDGEKDEISRNLQELGIEGVTEGEIEEVPFLESKRRDLEEKIQEKKVQIEVFQFRIEQLDNELKRLADQIKREKGLAERVEQQKRKFSLAREAANVVDSIFETIASDMRERIQTEARDIFKRLIWKSTQFQDICLSDDYRLDVIDRWGWPARPELSAGERQVLSLAFISGMARVSEEEAPLVMDTPFGRLSTAHRDNIALHIPKITKQLILFVTDEELRRCSREKMQPYIGKEYELVFNQETGSTTIEDRQGTDI